MAPEKKKRPDGEIQLFSRNGEVRAGRVMMVLHGRYIYNILYIHVLAMAQQSVRIIEKKKEEREEEQSSRRRNKKE